MNDLSDRKRTRDEFRGDVLAILESIFAETDELTSEVGRLQFEVTSMRQLCASAALDLREGTNAEEVAQSLEDLPPEGKLLITPATIAAAILTLVHYASVTSTPNVLGFPFERDGEKWHISVQRVAGKTTQELLVESTTELEAAQKTLQAARFVLSRLRYEDRYSPDQAVRELKSILEEKP